MAKEEIKVSAPGRICLFGEHQDYFGLPVTAAAINLRIHIAGRKNKDLKCKIDLPDIDTTEIIDLEKEVTYTKERDYLKSVINVLRREGIPLSQGWNCTVRGKIPINSGTSSSSALVVAWIKFLLEASGRKDKIHPCSIAELAFKAEVAEFDEPGGKMDHYTSAVGGIVNIRFDKKLAVKKFKNPLKEFVLADSFTKKDTTGTLAHIKNTVFNGMILLQKRIKYFHLNAALGPRERGEIERLPAVHRRLIKGTLKTRDLAAQGELLFQTDVFDHEQFGQLLNRQQDVLRDYLGVSSPKLNLMIATALEEGAIGAKINGSGEGGCIFAYCPENAFAVAEALRRLDTKTYIVHIDEGVKREA